MPTDIEDEFDALPDVFEGVDWDDVPDMAYPNAQPSMSNTSVMSGSTTDRGSPMVSSTHRITGNRGLHHMPDGGVLTSHPARRYDSPVSSHYSFDDFDQTFLEEVDTIETRLTQGSSSVAALASPSPASSAPRDPSAGLSPPVSQLGKRARSDSTSSCGPSPAKKGKLATAPLTSPPVMSNLFQDARSLLAEYEEELCCPICCDILAAAHLGNPCGHTYCGECGHDWIRSRNPPTCPICRTHLMAAAPMIPNFAMDSTIEKYVASLGSHANAEWSPTGEKYQEWKNRKERWKTAIASRISNAQRQSHDPRTGSHTSTTNSAVIDLTVVNVVSSSSGESSNTGDSSSGESSNTGDSSSGESSSGFEDAAPRNHGASLPTAPQAAPPPPAPHGQGHPPGPSASGQWNNRGTRDRGRGRGQNGNQWRGRGRSGGNRRRGGGHGHHEHGSTSNDGYGQTGRRGRGRRGRGG